jgi:chromate transporter
LNEISLYYLFKYYITVGATCFGGPLAIIDRIRFDLVLKRNLFSADEFKDIFGYSQIAPGPLAFQVSVYTGYFKRGFWGALVSGFALVLPSYVLVLVFSIFYKEYKDINYIRFALYGLSPVIIAIIVKSGYSLSRTIFQKDWFLYILFFLSIFLTIYFKAPIIYLILGEAVIALIYYLIKEKKINKNITTILSIFPVIFVFLITISQKLIFLFCSGINYFKIYTDAKLLQMALLFLKIGSLTYGSGFVIVGVLRQEVVDNLHWLNAKEFIDGIAFGQITPGPVVITSTFIGYMTSGIIGSLISTMCIFLPTFILVVLIATRINRFKDNFYLKSLIKGANAAALGAILSTAFLLSKDAILDIPTFILFILSATILVFTKFKEYYLILISSAAGILIKMLV